MRKVERTEGIEPCSAALGRRATQPVCLPARWLRPGNGLRRSKVVIRNESRPCAAGSFATSATAACLAFLLAACQTPTVVRDRIVEVKTPVAVQPVRPDQVPAVPAPLGARPRSLSTAADVLLSKVCEWVAYGLKADPLLRVSAGEPQQPLGKFPECER